MNYLSVYCKLVRKAENRNLTNNYYEKHHVFPLSIYGKNNRIVKFTYKEHFLAHLLLAKIFEKRYGKNNIKTKKMEMAIHRMVYTTDRPEIKHCSKDYEIARKAVKDSKTGKHRPDCYGKKYFGASKEKIKAGIEKMRKKKLGVPSWNKGKKNEYKLPHTEEWGKHISNGRQKTQQKYIAMSDDEFWNWVHKQQKYRTQKNSERTNHPNPNITKAMITRGIPLKKYYNLEDFNSYWLRRKNNKEKFYGL